MKHIGILTYWGVANFGAWAQAYALNNVVNGIVANDVKVEHINWLIKSHFDAYYRRDIKLYNAFDYSWRLIPHTKKMTEEDMETEYFDAVIVGSDAVWEFLAHQDKYLFCHDMNAKIFISYAPSFGYISANEKVPKYIISGLRKYDYISARDKHSANMAAMLTGGRMPRIVVDPALLHDFSHDGNVIEPKFDKYILVYGFSWDIEFIKNTVIFAKEQGCKLISAGYVNNWCDINLKMIELRSLEWIGLFKNASYVVTSTFHGLMLGISFGKQIKFYQEPHVVNRSATLVEELKLPDHKQNYVAEIDYMYARSSLDRLRKESLSFLHEALEGVSR